jgi:hypothetical protein
MQHDIHILNQMTYSYNQQLYTEVLVPNASNFLPLEQYYMQPVVAEAITRPCTGLTARHLKKIPVRHSM